MIAVTVTPELTLIRATDIADPGPFAEFVAESKLEIPPETCPTINQAIASVRAAEKLAGEPTRRFGRGRRFDEISDYQEALAEIESELSGVEGLLEEIRRANSDLRDLSYHWYELAKEVAAKADLELAERDRVANAALGN